MHSKLSSAALIIISLFVLGCIYYALTSAKVADFFTSLPLTALAGFGTVGGLIITGLMFLSIRTAIKKRRK